MANDANVKNVEELALFGRNIKQLGDNMLSAMQQAQKKMNQVCDGWHDEKADRFRADFDESIRMISRISEKFTEHSAYIKKLTDALNAYKNIR